jgi:hypothetical protein
MNEEFNLDQLLADPLIRMVMTSDAVEEADIRHLAGRLALRKAASPSREQLEPPRSARPAYRMPLPLSAGDCAAQSCFA